MTRMLRKMPCVLDRMDPHLLRLPIFVQGGEKHLSMPFDSKGRG